MFIRVKARSEGKCAIQLVESVRDGDKVRQKVLRHVGTSSSESDKEKLIALAELIKSQIEESHQPSLFSPEELADTCITTKQNVIEHQELKVDLRQLHEESRHITGLHEVYGEVYKQLGFDNILGNPARKVADHETIKHLTIARIANPCSKAKTVLNLEEDFGINLDLDRVYKVMDKMNESVINTICDRAYHTTKTLLGGKVDVLFYDCTTLYFECFGEDGFRENGYSKDLKFNQPQLVLALMVSKDGLPIGYEVFPGNCYEGHTLLPALTRLKERYALDKVVFVADSGMLNSENLDFLQTHGFSYIVGGRVKNMSKEIKAEVLDLSSYVPLEDNEDYRAKQIVLGEHQWLIANYSKKRARKDGHDRKKAIEKLLKKLKKSKDASSLISNYGYKKYLKINGKAQVELNQEKLEQEAKWDGLQGLITNVNWLDASEVIGHYKGLWQVEESFRINKHDLKIRPIYHYNESRIRAHLAICFMAFTCVRYLEHKVKLQGQTKLSPEVIRRELCHVQTSILRHKEAESRYALPSKMSQISMMIYRVMKLNAVRTPYQIS